MTGLILDMPERDYHAHPALSSTGARKLLPPSVPALFDYERKHPRKPTAAMLIGKAAHRLALGVGSAIQVADYPDFRSKEAREWRDAVIDADEVPMLEGSDDLANVRGMAAALKDHPDFPRLFDPERGDPEASLFWTDPASGVECRARLDFLPHRQDGRRLIVADYKTTSDLDPSSFARDAATYGYPMQDEFYLRGIRELDIDPNPAFVFVAQMRRPPYLVAVRQIPDQDRHLARARNDAALRIYAECTASGHWPGYEGVQRLDMPAWWRIQTEDLIDSLESETAA